MSIQISAIICTLNRAVYLKKAVQSLVNQTLSHKQYEIIIVDNGSTDNTKTIVNKFKHFRNLHYIYEPITGLSQARNRGWQNALGKYTAFLDDDAIAGAEWLARIVKVFETIKPRPGSVGGKIEPIWETDRPPWLSKQLELPLGIVDWVDKPTFLTENYQHLRGGNIAYPREILQKFGGFNTSLGRRGKNLLSNEENLLELYLEKSGLGSYYDPEIRVQHHILAYRLTKPWLYRRYFWQGVSDEVLQYIGNCQNRSKLHYLGQAFASLLCFFKNPRNLSAILLPNNTNNRVINKCGSYSQLGRIWAQLRIGFQRSEK